MKEKPEFDQEEDEEEEFSQSSENDALSSKSLASDDSDFEGLPSKKNGPV